MDEDIVASPPFVGSDAMTSLSSVVESAVNNFLVR